MNVKRSGQVTTGRTTTERGGALARLARTAAAMALALGIFGAAGASAQVDDPAPPPPPPVEVLECWELGPGLPPSVVGFGAMYCKCRGVVRFDWGPVTFDSNPPLGNGQLQPNCYAAIVSSPAQASAEPEGPFNLVPVTLPIRADYFECDNSGCYWFHGSAKCSFVREAELGFVTSYKVVGPCQIQA